MMKMPVRDLEKQGPVLTSDGNLRCGVPGSFVTWNMNVALWVVLNVAVPKPPPPPKPPLPTAPTMPPPALVS
jgi:hypothetical protein